MIDHAMQVAFDEEQVLAGEDAVGRGGEGIAYQQHRGLGTGVVDAGIPFGRDAKREIQRAGGDGREFEVRRQHDILWQAAGADLQRAAVEAEDEGAAGARAQQMKLTGGAHQDLAAAGECNGRGAVIGSDASVGEQLRLVPAHLQAAGDAGIACGDRTHGSGGASRGLLRPKQAGTGGGYQ